MPYVYTLYRYPNESQRHTFTARDTCVNMVLYGICLFWQVYPMRYHETTACNQTDAAHGARVHVLSHWAPGAAPAAAAARRALLNVLCLIMRQKKAAELQRRPMQILRSAGGVAVS